MESRDEISRSFSYQDWLEQGRGGVRKGEEFGRGRSLERGEEFGKGGERKFEGRRLEGKKYCFQFMKPKIIIIIRCRHTNLVFMSTVLFINHCSIEM